MLFNSLPFVAFLGVVCSLFYSLPVHLRPGWLLIASYFFYSWWNPFFLPLLISYTLFNYGWGQWLAKRTAERKLLLISGITVNLMPLLYYKYWHFVWNVDNDHEASSIQLPLGISFITLQAISYLADIYRRDIKPADLLPFALYKSFFPQLLAGPIERAGKLIPQLSFINSYSPRLFFAGGKLMLWGYFKKVLIADKIGLLIDPVFAYPHNYTALLLLIAPLLFSIQIYCDFSGYSDIARGIATLFGIHLSVNFCRPYGAFNLIHFWQRWHITLHDWFKDYVYRPLLGEQPRQIQRIGSILIIFLLSGLWHGANLTFLVWGLYHAGVYLVVILTRQTPFSLPKFVAILLTFLTVSLGWIFFRSPSLDEARYMITQLGQLQIHELPVQLSQSLRDIIQHTSLSSLSLWVILSLLLVFLLVESTDLLDNFLRTESGRVVPTYRLVLLDVFMLLLLLFGDWAGTSFIYFQF